MSARLPLGFVLPRAKVQGPCRLEQAAASRDAPETDALNTLLKTR